MTSRFSIAVSCLAAVSLSWAGTPTIDGNFDGESVWGTSVASNSTPGWAGTEAQELYVTSDANYVYFGALVQGVQNWMSYGFAIDCKNGGGNTQEPWMRQINFNFPLGSGVDQPDFVVRGLADNGWRELRSWNGTDWSSGAGTDIGASEAYAGNIILDFYFIECRVAKSVLSMRSSKVGQVEFFLTGDLNSHGLFTSVPYDTPAAEWNPSSLQSLSNPAAPVMLPVHVSRFIVE